MPIRADQVEKVRLRLAETFKTGEALLNPENHTVQLDWLWSTHGNLARSTELLHSFLTTHGHLAETTALMVADKLKVPFGVLPIAATLSHVAQKDLIIWKEHGEYFTGQPLIFGKGSSAPEIVGILHDVLAGGYAIIKMLEALSELSRTYEQEYIVRFVFSFVRLADEEELDTIILASHRRSPRISLARERFLSILDLSSAWERED